MHSRAHPACEEHGQTDRLRLGLLIYPLFGNEKLYLFVDLEIACFGVGAVIFRYLRSGRLRAFPLYLHAERIDPFVILKMIYHAVVIRINAVYLRCREFRNDGNVIIWHAEDFILCRSFYDIFQRGKHVAVIAWDGTVRVDRPLVEIPAVKGSPQGHFCGGIGFILVGNA